MRISLSIAAVGCFSLLAAQQAVAGPPYPLKASLKFDEKSPYAMVVFEAEPQLHVESWTMEVLAFSLETHTWTYGPLNGWSRFGDLESPTPERRFHAALVKPAGTYVVNNISSQGFWRVCFNGGTVAFTVEAGKVNYIGVIDPNPALLQIVTDLPKETRGQQLVAFDTPRLKLTPPSQRPDWNADLATFMAAKFPKVKAPIVAAEPVEMTFTPSRSKIAGKICQKY